MKKTQVKTENRKARTFKEFLVQNRNKKKEVLNLFFSSYLLSTCLHMGNPYRLFFESTYNF
jgi:hypothetical protein